VTFNAASVYLDRSPANDRIIQTLLPMFRLNDPALADGVVAIHYRARPEQDPGVPFVRSFIGLALFTADLRELYRYKEPVVYPDPMDDGDDVLGVEDPRITRIGDTFYMIYCGLKKDPATVYFTQLCSAKSKDLLHWEKLGPMKGDVNANRNKDGVLLPDAFKGKYWFLHRPWWDGLAHKDYAMHLAVCDTPEGVWKDLGQVMRSFPNPQFTESWIGAGSVPVPLGGGRYMMIYHTGNSKADGSVEYDLDAGLLDLSKAEQDPGSVVVGRLEHFMVPETPEELRSESSLQVQNVLFTCGSYEYEGDLYIIYGGADTYLLAARVKTAALWRVLEETDCDNPFQE
jgi:beta-1,2-mannobiose phosphorylase / 1,2-beta-oligomannan phosphorylase